MKKIVGKVVLRGTKTGIPDLFISLYNEAPEDTTVNTKEKPKEKLVRLASVFTDNRGAFSFELRSVSTNILVVVSAPEESCSAIGVSQKKLATCHRSNCGEIESFLVSIDENSLLEAGILIPGSLGALNYVIEQRKSSSKRMAMLREEDQRQFRERAEKRRLLNRVVESKFDQFIDALSGVPAADRSKRYVARGADVREVHQAVIRSGIENRINKTEVKGIIRLNDEQAAQLKDANGKFVRLEADSINPFLHADRLGKGPTLVNRPPLVSRCGLGPSKPCIEILKGNPVIDVSGNGTQSNGTGTETSNDQTTVSDAPSTPLDIPALIKDLLQFVTPPESTSIFPAGDWKKKVEDIEKVVVGVNGKKGFTLHSGPADAPSLHDFHHLQIAFEHVWQDLFDTDAEKHGKELYTWLVERNVDPNEYLWSGNDDLFTALKVLVDESKKEKVSEFQDPDIEIVSAFDITPAQWSILNSEQQEELLKLAATVVTSKGPQPTPPIAPELGGPGSVEQKLKDFLDYAEEVEAYNAQQGNYEALQQDSHDAMRKAKNIIRYADYKLNSSKHYRELHQILADLEKSLQEIYRFSIYAANGINRSINYGIVTTYRQQWTPVSYQVGELVKTIPLAPKEVRRFSTKMNIKKSRAEKEVQNNLHAQKTDLTDTARAETTIVHKAQKKSNFQLSAEGGVNIGIAEVSGRTGFSADAATESNEVKKEFRESVFKAAEEYKSERILEVNTSVSEDLSTEESGEINNPNDEITVTYLFYQLQRRFNVQEKIHRLTPVILVAQAVPNPGDITYSWIISHDWILRRVILDDSFKPALNYVTKVVGDEYALQETFQNIQQHRRIVDELKEQLIEMKKQEGSRYAALQSSIEQRAQAIAAEAEDDGLFTPLDIGKSLLDDGSNASPEAQQVRESAARDAYDREVKLARELQSQLEREITALNSLTETYTKNLSEHLNRKAQLDRLRVHIKSNIMYYMQAIWSHEPPDQRFFRLHEVRVPKLNGKLTYTIVEDDEAVPLPPDWVKPHKLTAQCDIDPDNIEFETLEEVADIDNMLGFKGNYMMFPLKRSNVLTDFMTIPYLDPVNGLIDPDPLGNWTLSSFAEYACCLYHTLTKKEFEKKLPGLMEVYKLLINSPGVEGEEIIVPTTSLFIEALPGVHPVLEDFKMFHRAIDVKKVQADVRAIELENLRLASRLIEGEREDPTIEKKIVIEGGQTIVSPDQ